LNRHTLRCGFDVICAIAVRSDVLFQGDSAAELVSENVEPVQDKDQLHLSLPLSAASPKTTNGSGRKDLRDELRFADHGPNPEAIPQTVGTWVVVKPLIERRYWNVENDRVHVREVWNPRW
jgi:hypothetical protein